ncbi:uncharacterized protein LOC142628366 [Castanea sativa]|uniref:uncharacterized protein LOC142628366 n=1 Tax=Castanea sativa TaxID=21020 RepID=UPI003F64AA1E
MSLVTEEIKAKAEYNQGHQFCQEKSKLLLTEMGLPNGLLPLQDIEEFSAYIEHKKIKRLSGVKAKELMIWVTLNEIFVDDPPTNKITIKSLTGLSRTLPVSALEIEDGKDL